MKQPEASGPPWRGKGSAFLERAAADRSGLLFEALSWLFVASAFVLGSGLVALIAFITLVVVSLIGIMIGIRQLSKRLGSSPISASPALAVGFGALGVVVGLILIIIFFVFPINIWLFGLCSANPDNWLCLSEIGN